MALKLPSGMREYYGRNVDRMPEILQAGEVPMSTARFMKERLSDGEKFPDLWCYSGTSDLPIHPQSLKFGNDSVYTFLTVNNQGRIANQYARKALELIVPGNLTRNYGAVIPDEMFEEWKNLGDKIGLIKIPRNKIIANTYLTNSQILDEQMWRVLARHPNDVPAEFAEERNLLERYTAEVESKTKASTNMSISLESSLEDKTTLKAWYVYWLEDGSNAIGRCDLDFDLGRLVGLAPEAQSAQDKYISEIK